MNLHDQFLNYVTHGGRPICSPQIGAGAGFDAKLAGKEWISQTTLADTLAAVARFDVVPLINIGLCDLGECSSELKWREVRSLAQADRITKEYVLRTPKGALTRTVVEEKRKGSFQTKYPVDKSDDLPALEWYLDAALRSDFTAVTYFVKDAVSTIAGHAALCVQWAVQPYELLCFPNTVDTVLLAHDQPVEFRRLMNHRRRQRLPVLRHARRKRARHG